MKLCINSEYAPEYLKEAAEQYAEVWQINEAMFVHGSGTSQKLHNNVIMRNSKSMPLSWKNTWKNQNLWRRSQQLLETDHSATFMRIKTDYMGNDQLLPAYKCTGRYCR